MAFCDSDLYKTVNVISDFADWDTTARLKHSLRSWCDSKDSGFFPYETILGKTMNILTGIDSSLNYMHLSILYSSSEISKVDYASGGFREYDIYRYHYIVFCHSIALLQDLLFKLTSTIYGFKVPPRMIGWNDIKDELENNKLDNIKSLLEDFFTKFSKHIKKRNKFSHEGLLSYRTLDSFYMTYIWSGVQRDTKESNLYPEYTDGTGQNKELLKSTKNDFVEELRQLTIDAESCALCLFEACSEKLLEQIEPDFWEKHSVNMRGCNHKHLNEHLSKLGL